MAVTTYKSTNGRWGVTTNLPYGKLFKGSVSFKQMNGQFRIVKGIEEGNDLYLLERDLEPIENCELLFCENLQSGKSVSLIKVIDPSKRAIASNYGYLRRRESKVMIEDGVLIIDQEKIAEKIFF